MTPLEIEIALHYYTTPGQYRNGDFSAPAVGQAIQAFEDAGLLRRDHGDCIGNSFKATDGLQAYVRALLSVPLPVQKWVIPDNSPRVSLRDAIKGALDLQGYE